MVRLPDATSWCAELPWLAELGLGAGGILLAAGITPLLAMAWRRLGPRCDLARAADGGEAVGVDIVHAAVNELLAQHALPQQATMAVAGDARGGFVEAVAGGTLRALRGHGLPVAVPLAVRAATEQVALCLVGTPLSAARAVLVGDVVLALRSTGPTDGDFAMLSRCARERGLDVAHRLANGDRVDAALLAPRKSHCSVMHEGLRQGWQFTASAVDGSLHASVARLLPAGCDVAWDFAAWRPGAPFDSWFPGNTIGEAAEHTSAGASFVLIVAAADVGRWSAHFAAWGEPATAIGRIVAGCRG